MEKLSPPVRIFALVAVLVAVAGALMMFVLSRGSTAIAPVVSAKTASAAATKAAPPATKAKAPAPAPVVNPVVPPTGFPVAVDKALRKYEVVVVSLVVPGARVDELAADEARAGAKLGGAGFLALNVLNEGVARALLTKLDGLHDPSLLVITRGGTVALQLNGFVDRDTVAQAAANATS